MAVRHSPGIATVFAGSEDLMTQPDKELAAFRLGDIRGIYPTDIDESFVEQFAHAFAGHFDLNGRVVTGRDMRDSS